MARPLAAPLKPRKTPSQARSATTVEAIFEATIQVLLAGGESKLTTTRVAERAGVSVATDFDTEDLIGEGSQRVLLAIERLLISAADATFESPGAVSFVLRAVLGGSVRNVLERGATPAELTILRAELPLLCRAYLLASAQRIAQSPIQTQGERP